MLIGQLDPLTEQQVVGIYSLQQSSQQAEEALSQGLEQLQQSLIDTIATASLHDGMHHMALALGKLSNLEGFVRQVTLVLTLRVTSLILPFHLISISSVMETGVSSFDHFLFVHISRLII